MFSIIFELAGVFGFSYCVLTSTSATMTERAILFGLVAIYGAVNVNFRHITNIESK